MLSRFQNRFIFITTTALLICYLCVPKSSSFCWRVYYICLTLQWLWLMLGMCSVRYDCLIDVRKKASFKHFLLRIRGVGVNIWLEEIIAFSGKFNTSIGLGGCKTWKWCSSKLWLKTVKSAVLRFLIKKMWFIKFFEKYLDPFFVNSLICRQYNIHVCNVTKTEKGILPETLKKHDKSYKRKYRKYAWNGPNSVSGQW